MAVIYNETNAPAYRAEVSDASQLEQALKIDDFEFIYAPEKLLDENTADKDRIIVVPPVFLGGDEKNIEKRLIELKACGFRRVMAHTLGHIGLISAVGMTACGGFRLNLTNSLAMAEYEKLGLSDAVLSIELTLSRARAIKRNIPAGLIAYGKIPLMLTRRCPIADGKTCRGVVPCGKKITDRRGNELSVMCNECAELLNPDVLVLSDKIGDLAAFDFAVLRFTTEKNVSEILAMYKDRKKPEGTLTRGLYYRGTT